MFLQVNKSKISQNNRTLKHIKYFLIFALLPFTIEGGKSSNYNQIQKKTYQQMEDDSMDYPSIPASPPTGPCSSLCKRREELKTVNLAIIKDEILKRMGFSQPPNITGKVLPPVPQHYLDILGDQGMQADQPYKTGMTYTEEDDEYHVRTQKVLTWAESYPRLRHSWKMDILHFPFSDSITKFHVANATLNIFITGSNSDRQPQQDVLIEIYKVNRLGDHSQPLSLSKVRSWKEPQTMRGKWVQVDFTETVGEWFKNARENFGFVINATVNGKKLTLSDVITEKRKAPYVETSVTEPKRRKRRNSGLNCDENANEPLCCRYSFVVDFVEIGLDFIIAPKRYDAHMCSGECPYVTLQKHPHTHLLKMSQPNTAAPCCAPRKMSPISMLYFDDKLNVVFGSLPGMVVDRCGCS